MPEFVYTGTDPLDVLYPRAFTVEHGDVIESDENPNPYWFELAKPASKARKTKED